MKMQFKSYFRDFRKGRNERNLLEVMVFILYLLSKRKHLYTNSWRFANLIETLKLKKLLLRNKIKRKNEFVPQLTLTQTVGFNIAYRVNIYLSLLTRLGYPFPIKSIKTTWQNEIDYSSGVIFISVHLPLIKVAIAELIKAGHSIDAGISASDTPDGKMAFWGITQRVPIIHTGEMSLLKAKSILKNRGSIVMMADTGLSSIIYPNIFKLAAKLNTRIMFLLAYLNEQGVIEISLFEPPYVQSSTLPQIEENMTALRIARDEILAKYAQQFLHKTK